MKKIFIFISALTISTISLSQSQFTVNDCFQLNDSSKLGFAVYSQSYQNFISQTGNNYTWDFSTNGWSAPTTSYKFQPSSQSIHSLFNQSEINEYSNVMFARDLFFTHSSNQDTLYYEGLYTSTNYKYAPRVPYLTFPLNYQDSIYVYLKQFANPNQPTTATGSVTRYWIYDGFGSINLPYGTINNVFRIRTKQIDSVYVLNSGSVAEEIIWFKQNEGIPVLRFQKNSTVINAYYASSSTISGIKESSKTPMFTIFPNPATENITIKSSTELLNTNFSIIDINGKTVMKGSIKNLSENIDISKLTSGIYAISNDHFPEKSAKFIKK